MRGHVDPQGSMFSYFSPESRIPEAHPLRPIKADADKLLASLSGEFEDLYAATGRPSIPPERLLKASLLIALYTVRSDRLFCEMLDYNILFRWFLDMSLEEKGLDQSGLGLGARLPTTASCSTLRRSKHGWKARRRKVAWQEHPDRFLLERRALQGNAEAPADKDEPRLCF